MSNLFSGLEAFGLGKLSKEIEVYGKDEENAKKDEKQAAVKPSQPVFLEEDIIFEKTIVCPVCDYPIKVKTVKTGKVKLLSADTDLRPKYQYVDSLKYDAIVCPSCGYAALRRYFNFTTNIQSKLIKENITANFRGLEPEGSTLSYDEAINRHKLSLVSAIVKRAKLSEKAYICLKTAWLFRGKEETLPLDTPNYEKVVLELKNEENEFISKAYEGFKEAFAKENFPMCGMDEDTCTYLVADLARRVGKFDDASRWVSKVLISKSANERIKERARNMKEFIKSQTQE